MPYQGFASLTPGYSLPAPCGARPAVLLKYLRIFFETTPLRIPGYYLVAPAGLGLKSSFATDTYSVTLRMLFGHAKVVIPGAIENIGRNFSREFFVFADVEAALDQIPGLAGLHGPFFLFVPSEKQEKKLGIVS